MKCPICDVNLQMTERQGIEIDYCPQCRGIWLDRGELDKLIERSTEAAWDEARGSDRGRRVDDDDYRKYKKKSLWKELFDF
jgi:Zn-finger nucleic acid-binding protein